MRGERDRHVRGAGCGGRRRCGVTRFTGDVCLRAGRICASTATGKETADLRMERPLDSVTDDQIKTRSAYSLEAPFPSPWDINWRSDRSPRQSASNRKNTAGGTPGTRSAPPKVPMHSTLRKTAFASGPRVHGHPAFRTPSRGRVGRNAQNSTRKRRENASVCFHVTEAGTATPLDLGKHSCLLLRRTAFKTPLRRAHGQTRIT